MKRPAKVSRKPFRQLTRKIQRNIDNVRDIAREDDVVSRRVERIQDALDRAVEEADKSHKTALKIAIGIPVMFIFLALLTSAFTNP
jgi:hypothetical protein